MPNLKKKRASGSSDLLQEVTDLKWSIVHAVDTFKRVNQARRMLALSFLKGAISVLGAVAMAVIVLPVAIWVMRSVEWPPIIQGLVTMVIDQIEQSSRQLQQGVVDQ